MSGIHGIIFAYQKRANLQELVSLRASASVPFGGRYRAIDFGISNLVNAGASDVGVIVHERYQSLLDHIGTGKDFDLSKKRGGMRILPPFAAEGSLGSDIYRGKMEALGSVRSYIADSRADHMVLMDGDLVTNLPLRDIYEKHLESGADITVVCGDDSFYVDRGTYYSTDENGRVTDILFNVHTPKGRRGLEVFVISKKLLLDLIDDCVSHDKYSLRKDVLQARKDELVIKTYVWNGFAAQVRSVKEYFDRSMQLLLPSIQKDLFCAERPIRAKSADKSSAFISPGGSVHNSIIADGCSIYGTVENSILFPGVTVEKGSIIRNCVLFKETFVGQRSEVAFVIADKRVQFAPGSTIIGSVSYPIVIAKESKI
ncbi:MAG: glucose-1-phosphate adenylyltransferase subunit GlgD [Lachnospiraceae bacterium]|nr:glucose-1-phosphate adenylyltransferase subunit GlgD [Lachnospiraceae bacterium]